MEITFGLFKKPAKTFTVKGEKLPRESRGSAYEKYIRIRNIPISKIVPRHLGYITLDWHGSYLTFSILYEYRSEIQMYVKAKGVQLLPLFQFNNNIFIA